MCSLDSKSGTDVPLVTQIFLPEFNTKREAPMHPGIHTQPDVVSVVSITSISSSTNTSAKMVVVYDSGTAAIHKWSSKRGASIRFQWSAPKEIPMQGASAVHWKRDISGAAAKSKSQHDDWWMSPREQLFVYSKPGKIMFWGGSWDNQVKCCAVDLNSSSKPFSHPSNISRGGGSTFRNVVTCVSFAEDGTTLGVGGLDCTCQIFVWNASDRDMHRKHVLVMHSGAITSMRLSVKLDIVVSSSLDGKIGIHTLTSGQLLRVISHRAGMAWDGVWLMGISKGEVLAYSHEEQRLHLFSVQGDSLMTSSGAENVLAVAITENGETLITGGVDGTLTFRSLASSLQIVRKVRLETTSAVTCIEMSRHHNMRPHCKRRISDALQVAVRPPSQHARTMYA